MKLGPLDASDRDRRSARSSFDQLYVLKDHHGTGIAAAADGLGARGGRPAARAELYLTVYVDNHRARRFYERYGFEAVGSYDFMVGDQADDDIIMRKAL